MGGNRAQIIQRVTGTIPIVTLSAAELVTSGVVASLARPGGTITGMQSYSPELQGKRLQILKELMPKLSRVAVLRRAAWHPGMLAAYQQPADSAAQKLGLRLHYVVFQTSDELPGAFAGLVAERAGAIVIWVEPGITLHVREIPDLAARHRLPTIAEGPTWLDGGALVAYGSNQEDLWRQAATHVVRILKGARPGDLPIGQPTTFEMTINMKTAKTLGLTPPPSLLQRADRIIE